MSLFLCVYVCCMCYDVCMCAHEHMGIPSPMSVHVEASSHHQVLSSTTLCLIFMRQDTH